MSPTARSKRDLRQARVKPQIDGCESVLVTPCERRRAVPGCRPRLRGRPLPQSARARRRRLRSPARARPGARRTLEAPADLAADAVSMDTRSASTRARSAVPAARLRGGPNRRAAATRSRRTRRRFTPDAIVGPFQAAEHGRRRAAARGGPLRPRASRVRASC